VPVVLPDGQAVLRVEFTAPSPLQVSGSQGSRVIGPQSSP